LIWTIIDAADQISLNTLAHAEQIGFGAAVDFGIEPELATRLAAPFPVDHDAVHAVGHRGGGIIEVMTEQYEL
jgi:hypothetical protein